MLAAALALMLPAGIAAGGQTLYVEVGASTGGTGSEFAPMKTIGGGVFKLRQPGDELVVKKGLYVGSLKLEGLKGQRGAPIVVRGIREEIPEEERKQPNISPAKYAPMVKATGEYAIHIKDCSFIRIEGLLVTGASSHGVFVESSDHVELKDCDIFDNVRTQLKFQSSYHPIVTNCIMSGSVLEHGLEYWMGDKPEVRDCRVFDNAGSGIYLHADKLNGDGLVDRPVIESNILWNNGKLKPGVVPPRDRRGRPQQPGKLRYGSAAIAADGSENGVFRNNLVHHNAQGGVVLFRNDAERAGLNNHVTHNTIYMGENGGSAYGVYLALMSQGTNVNNNIIVTASGPCIWLDKGATRDMRSDFNVLARLDNKDPLQREKEFLTLQRWQEVYRLDRNSIVFRPSFVDPENADRLKCDFKLASNSTLAGRSPFDWAAPQDMFGSWRPRNRVTPGMFELRPVNENPNQPNNQPQQNRPGHRPDWKKPGEDDKEKDPPIDPGPIVLPPL